MNFKIVINMDNAAFGDTDMEKAVEVARILKRYAQEVSERAKLIECDLRDYNGNNVGSAYITK